MRRDVPDLARRRAAAASSATTRPTVSEGMVVLDAVHQIQAEQANDLAVRWNCKAGKCGSCSAEVNGKPRLMCMTRLNQLDLLDSRSRSSRCARSRRSSDLVTDVSWNFEVKKKIKQFKPRPPDAPDGTWRMAAGRRRARAGVPQVHRVLPLPGRLPRAARPPDASTSSSARATSSTPRRSRCTRSTPRTALRELKDDARHRLLQHHEVLHQGLPGEHHDHRQRDHPAEGARRRSVLRSGRQAVPDVPLVNRTEVAMEFELKTLSPEAVPRALAKAERYRLLNEPGEAESICLDALEVEPDNQEALATLLLALTDQFDDDRVVASPTRGRRSRGCATTTSAPTTPGIIHERRAKAQLAARHAAAAARAPTNGCARR